jgi:hypothetical protein
MAFRVFAALLAGVAIGVGAGALRWRHEYPPPYNETRSGFVRTALGVAGPVDTLILGDSVGESLWLDCGRAFNASVGRSTVSDVAALAPLALRVKPKTTILIVGANDNWEEFSPQFERDYSALVRSLPGKLILVGVPNNARADAVVRSISRRSAEAAYIQPAMQTSDGVHPTVEGATKLRGRIEQAC